MPWGNTAKYTSRKMLWELGTSIDGVCGIHHTNASTTACHLVCVFQYFHCCMQSTCIHVEYKDWASSSFPRRRSPITESTREVLFLFYWCFCAWLPPSLYLRDPRASLGDCEDRSRSRPLRRKWSGASPRPPLGGSPLVGTTPLLLYIYIYIYIYKIQENFPSKIFPYCLPK